MADLLNQANQKRKECPLLLQSYTVPSLTIEGESSTRSYFSECIGERCAAYRAQNGFCEKWECTVAICATNKELTKENNCPLPNVPLTKKQLIKMGSGTVWIKTKTKEDWFFLEKINHKSAKLCWWPAHYSNEYDLSLYGKTWFAYSAKSEHINQNAWEPCSFCKSCGNCKEAEKATGEKINYTHPCHSCLNGDNFNPVAFCRYCGRPLTEKAWGEQEKRCRRIIV